MSDDFYAELADERLDEVIRLRAENEKLRAAAEEVVKWWLSDGTKHFDGAPFAMFAIRQALERNSAAAALRETGND